MIRDEELKYKPGGHVRQFSVKRNSSFIGSPSHSPELNSGLESHSLSASTKGIAMAHQKATMEAQKTRDKARDKIKELVKHRKVANLIKK